MRFPQNSDQLGIPRLDDLSRRVLIALAAMYVLQLLAGLTPLDVMALAWSPFGAGFRPWQPLTFWMVQPWDPFNVLLGLLVLFLFLPVLMRELTPRALLEAVGASAAGGAVLVLATDAAGLGIGGVMGWNTMIGGLVCLFGLLHPNAEIRLYFLFPIKGIWLVWGTLALAVAVLLVAVGPGGNVLSAAFAIGSWCGTWAWWRWRGPGSRMAALRRAGAKVERGVRRFEALPGGRDNTWH